MAHRSIEEEEAERYRQDRATYLVSIVTDETAFIARDFDADARSLLANAWTLDPTAVSERAGCWGKDRRRQAGVASSGTAGGGRGGAAG